MDQFPNLARRLTEVFDRAVTAAVEAGLELRVEDRPTLSVGVVIAHRKEDLRAVRHKAEAALQEAKDRRRETRERRPGDGPAEGFLAVREEPAGGDTRHTAGPLSEVVDRLLLWSEAFVDPERAERPARGGSDLDTSTSRESPDAVRTREVSLSLAHDLLGLYRRFTGADDRNPGGWHTSSRQRDSRPTSPPVGLALARAMMAIKVRRSGWDASTDLQARFSKEEVQSWEDVRRVAHEILIAARINEVAAQRTPPANRVDAARTVSRRRRVS